MDRNELITQVKQEYSALASTESRDTFINQQSGGVSPESYYEELLGQVIDGITAGKFDQFNSGSDIVDAVANNKAKWLGSSVKL